MRKRHDKRMFGLLCAGVLAGSAVFAGSAPAAAQVADAPRAAGTARAHAGAEDIRDRLESIPGMKVVRATEQQGRPLYELTYAQPVDHRNPAAGTFDQHLILWHKATDKPTVFFTPGYSLPSDLSDPSYDHPLTQILDANQISVEHRYFGDSRPSAGEDWSKLTVQQEAADEHRITRALRGIEKGKWIGTGSSKGGAVATYHERFYPDDLDGVVAVVAPNDTPKQGDRGYERFFKTVGTAECRDAVNAVQREMLVRRDALLPAFEAQAKAEGITFDVLGSADRAYEYAVLDQVWGFWMNGTTADCATVPDAKKATDDELYSWSKEHGLYIFGDGEAAPGGGAAFNRQAATQLGWPALRNEHLDGLLRHPGLKQPNSLLPAAVQGSYDGRTATDVDRWVRTKGERMLFLYAGNDPWSAEQFTPSGHDSHRYVAPGANHWQAFEKLPPEQLAEAVGTIKRWANVK
ncbi:S28 family serine protease [Streptomyces venezuelae]|uniref:S28 family serine protease n=1 Tax=Streptomyces venezuelae TaxID=54571 RepID=UPI003455E145